MILEPRLWETVSPCTGLSSQPPLSHPWKQDQPEPSHPRQQQSVLAAAEARLGLTQISGLWPLFLHWNYSLHCNHSLHCSWKGLSPHPQDQSLAVAQVEATSARNVMMACRGGEEILQVLPGVVLVHGSGARDRGRTLCDPPTTGTAFPSSSQASPLPASPTPDKA